MESQPQNPEFRNNPENFHPCDTVNYKSQLRVQQTRKDLYHSQAFIKSITKKYFSYFSTKTFVVGTQKKRLRMTVLLSTQNIC